MQLGAEAAQARLQPREAVDEPSPLKQKSRMQGSFHVLLLEAVDKLKCVYVQEVERGPSLLNQGPQKVLVGAGIEQPSSPTRLSLAASPSEFDELSRSPDQSVQSHDFYTRDTKHDFHALEPTDANMSYRCDGHR
jgi:hypothetical protein